MNHGRILRCFFQHCGQKASALLALFACAFLPLHAASLDDLTWTTTDGEITITDCDVAATGELVIPDTIEGNPVTSIGNATFWSCTSLTSITIGDGVTSVGDFAFFRCTNLTSITIGNGVTSIGASAFNRCSSLTAIEVGVGNVNYTDVNGVLFNTEKTILVAYPAGKTGNYTIPDSVTSIGNATFWSCTSLTSITIPDSVTSIGGRAFQWCDSLESITIPDSVASIENWAFFGCASLASVTIGKSVTSIGASAFRYCNALESITFLGSATTAVGVNAFSGVAAGAVAIMLGEEQASFGEVGAAWNGLTLVDGRAANDHFRNSQVIAGVSGNVFGSNVNATLESSEPTTVAGFEAGGSVWFSWEAPATETFRFHLTADFDSQLAIFTGEAVGALTVHGESDPPDGSSELVTLAANRGANYWVRVTGDSSQSGEFLLDWGAEPANDQFGNPRVIAGASGQVSRSNRYASLQPGEPTTTDGIPAGNSVWFSWEAPATGTFSFHLTADFDSQLAIFTGEAVGALTVHGESDPEFGRGDSVILITDEGTNYWVRVTGDSSQRGTFTLDWSNAPANDKFGRPQWITGIEVEGSLSGSNVNATLQPGEPRTVGGHSAGSSVWFAWEAPATGTFSLRLIAADFDSQLAIFTGDRVAH